MLTRVGGGQTFNYAYDAENRLTSVSNGATAVFVYDGDGNRVKATIGGATTVYIGNYFEWTGSTGTMIKYFYAGTQRVAMKKGSTVYYLFGDHLGSTAISTNSTGTKVGELRYKPWGESRYTWGTTYTNRHFTGQYDETASFGLYYYGARWYDSSLGRFAQPDIIVPEPGNPQAWDRYEYALNSPLKYTDPTGHWIESAIDVLSIGYDIYDISTNGLNWENGLSLAADVISLALPVVAGGGLMVRSVAHADDAADATRVLNNAVDAAQATNSRINAAQVTNQADNLVDSAKSISPMELGDRYHYDQLNGGSGIGGPSQLQQRYPNTEFAFARRGSSGPDVTYRGGTHPSSYPHSSWPQGFDYGDFKPNTRSGSRTFYNDLNSGKLPSDTIPLPYNQSKFKLLDDYNFGPQ